MDPIATALTAAWLDAVRRAQSERIQRLEAIMPTPAPAGGERPLTDVIEGGLKSGGAAPLAESDPRTGDRAGRPSIHLVDVLV